MSFGWSAGDIASAVKLIVSIVSSLRSTSGAREQFQELEAELVGLQRALKQIDLLANSATPPLEIQALKFVSLSCCETLQRFHTKIKPFEDSLGTQSQRSKLKAAPRMVRWELLVKKDLPELRQYLMAHVGYINLELSTASLKSTSRANNCLKELCSRNEYAIALIEKRRENSALTDKRVEELRETIDRVWDSNDELANSLRALAKRITSPPDSRFTWVQEPIRFENALGNVIPIASESDWDILEAIILAQFSKEPGRRKVFAGEYELFERSADPMHPMTLPVNPMNHPRLRPGMRITMAIVIGQYSGSQRCPRLGCSAKSVSNAGVQGSPGTLCSSCGAWVRKSYKILPKPLRPPALGDVAFRPPVTDYIRPGPELLSKIGTSPALSSSYPDQFAYKNISIYVTELPPTPKFIKNSLWRGRVPYKAGYVRELHPCSGPSLASQVGRASKPSSTSAYNPFHASALVFSPYTPTVPPPTPGVHYQGYYSARYSYAYPASPHPSQGYYSACSSYAYPASPYPSQGYYSASSSYAPSVSVPTGIPYYSFYHGSSASRFPYYAQQHPTPPPPAQAEDLAKDEAIARLERLIMQERADREAKAKAQVKA